MGKKRGRWSLKEGEELQRGLEDQSQIKQDGEEREQMGEGDRAWKEETSFRAPEN